MMRASGLDMMLRTRYEVKNLPDAERVNYESC